MKGRKANKTTNTSLSHLPSSLSQALKSPYQEETAAQHREEEDDKEEREEEEKEEEEERKNERGEVEEREEVLIGEQEEERKETDFDTKTYSATSQWGVTPQCLSDSPEEAESVFDEHLGNSIKTLALVNKEFETQALFSGPIRERSAEAEHYGTCQEEVEDEEECLLLELVKKTKSALCQDKHTRTYTQFMEHTHTSRLSQGHTHPCSVAGADLEPTRDKIQGEIFTIYHTHTHSLLPSVLSIQPSFDDDFLSSGAVMKIRLLEAAEGVQHSLASLVSMVTHPPLVSPHTHPQTRHRHTYSL